jgi:hypothetical protein
MNSTTGMQSLGTVTVTQLNAILGTEFKQNDDYVGSIHPNRLGADFHIYDADHNLIEDVFVSQAEMGQNNITALEVMK